MTPGHKQPGASYKGITTHVWPTTVKAINSKKTSKESRTTNKGITTHVLATNNKHKRQTEIFARGSLPCGGTENHACCDINGYRHSANPGRNTGDNLHEIEGDTNTGPTSMEVRSRSRRNNEANDTPPTTNKKQKKTKTRTRNKRDTTPNSSTVGPKTRLHR